MFDIVRKEMEWGGETLSMETGKVARQADGSVIVTYGETTVMANVVFDKQPKAGLDFFPLTVNYNEKYYAAGKIPGGFFKREARPTEKETLTSRLIDRPIRPLFPDGFRNDVQVIATVLSSNADVDADTDEYTRPGKHIYTMPAAGSSCRRCKSSKGLDGTCSLCVGHYFSKLFRYAPSG